MSNALINQQVQIQTGSEVEPVENDADTRNFIHKAAALPFTPPRIAWTLVKPEAPQTSESDEFIQYECTVPTSAGCWYRRSDPKQADSN